MPKKSCLKCVCLRVCPFPEQLRDIIDSVAEPDSLPPDCIPIGGVRRERPVYTPGYEAMADACHFYYAIPEDS